MVKNMNKLYLITGPCGIGKSTISKELAFNLKKSVLIEGDDIYHQVVGGYVQAWKEGNHLDIFWKEVENSIKLYLVIVSNTFQISQSQYIIRSFCSKRVHYF